MDAFNDHQSRYKFRQLSKWNGPIRILTSSSRPEVNAAEKLPTMKMKSNLKKDKKKQGM